MISERSVSTVINETRLQLIYVFLFFFFMLSSVLHLSFFLAKSVLYFVALHGIGKL
jgi:hypothetical protein